MKVMVRVIPRAKRQEVVQTDDGILKIKLVSAPIKGRANKELIDVLADFYKVRKSAVRIVQGSHTRDKIVEIIT